MFNIYDRCSKIILNNGRIQIEFEYIDEIQDFDDYIIIMTHVAIANVDRGWRGDLTFRFKGWNVNNLDEVTDCLTLKDVLCSARKFNTDGTEAVAWEYKFLKY